MENTKFKRIKGAFARAQQPLQNLRKTDPQIMTIAILKTGFEEMKRYSVKGKGNGFSAKRAQRQKDGTFLIGTSAGDLTIKKNGNVVYGDNDKRETTRRFTAISYLADKALELGQTQTRWSSRPVAPKV